MFVSKQFLVSVVITLCFVSVGSLLGALAYSRATSLSNEHTQSLCAIRHQAQTEADLYTLELHKPISPFGITRAFLAVELKEKRELVAALHFVKCK